MFDANDFAVFSDESRHTQGRYRSIAAVSLPASCVVSLTKNLKGVLGFEKRRELKWHGVGERGHRDVDRAMAVIDFLLAQISEGVRADVVTWDTCDERHEVPDRDDIANYERMFFHLHRALMKRRGLESRWHLRPDEQVSIDWETIAQCLNSDGTWWPSAGVFGLSEELRSLLPAVLTFRQVDSSKTPLCQVADLLVGVAAYTRTEANLVRKQMAGALGQQRILFQPHDSRAPSARGHGRFRVVSHLYHECKSRRLGVSLREHGYLRSHDPSMPLNFWHYTPQHTRDRAPTRAQTRSANTAASARERRPSTGCSTG